MEQYKFKFIFYLNQYQYYYLINLKIFFHLTIIYLNQINTRFSFDSLIKKVSYFRTNCFLLSIFIKNPITNLFIIYLHFLNLNF